MLFIDTTYVCHSMQYIRAAGASALLWRYWIKGELTATCSLKFLKCQRKFFECFLSFLDHCTVHIWTFLYGLIIRTNARHEDRRGYHTTKEIMDLRSKSSLLRQIIVIGLIIMLITSTESMPRPGMKKQRHRKSRNAIKSCKNGCYMEYYNCGTMVTSEIDHLVCLTAKSICVANCKATW